jgi:hypothetical protein
MATLPQQHLPLAENQVWKVRGRYVEIVIIGKRLVHYKVAKTMKGQAAKAVPIRLCKREELEKFLKSNRARRIHRTVSTSVAVRPH